MNQRDKIISLFDDNITSKVGFFVMGGVFSEGIDFVGDKLSGVLIVSVALPQINYTNELLKEHFDERFNDGFNYSYTYPGFNKLLQSAGRVIRSNEDKGVIIIADKRITNYKYLSMIPSHWNHYKRINNIKILEQELKNFWNKK